MAEQPTGQGLPPHLQNLFRSIALPFQKFKGANQYGPNLTPVGKGSLVKFYYAGVPGKSVIHDHNPVVILYSMKGKGTDQSVIRGVNIRYLTFPYIKHLLSPNVNSNNCDNPSISYNNIKGDKYITDAFRSYKRVGVKRLRKLDCEFITSVLGGMRGFHPSEIDEMRQYVRDALKGLQQAPRRPTGMAKEYMDWVAGGQATPRSAPGVTPPTTGIPTPPPLDQTNSGNQQ
jgi:hypothetical protein